MVIPKSRQLGLLAASAALPPVAGAHLQQVCCLPPPGCCACLSTADVQGQGVLGSVGRVSQLGRGRRGRGLSPRVTPTWAHTSTESLCLHLVSWQWDGQGQGAPSVGRVEPKLCKRCVEAACTSRGCKRVRNGGFVYIPAGSSFPLPPLFEVSAEQHRMNILGLSDMALFCSSSTSAPPKPPGLCCSHQDLFSSLWQAQSEQATSNQSGGGQKDGNHLGYPYKGGKDGVPQDGTKLAKPIEDAKGCCPVRRKAESNG